MSLVLGELACAMNCVLARHRQTFHTSSRKYVLLVTRHTANFVVSRQIAFFFLAKQFADE
jgi:hypothetical protein